MKRLGLIGGTGWVSTIDYYRFINREVKKRLGGLNSAEMFIYSFNYSEISKLNQIEDYDSVYKLVETNTKKIIDAGADAIMLCANTLHKFADRLEQAIDKPIIHIAEATAAEINKHGMTKAGLLGTKYTMEWDFYTSRLSKAGITPITPKPDDRQFVHNTIYDELLKEIFLDTSKERFLKIIDDLKNQGAETIILGCTEIPLIIKQDDCKLPLLNTLEIHCKAGVDFSLSN